MLARASFAAHDTQILAAATAMIHFMNTCDLLVDARSLDARRLGSFQKKHTPSDGFRSSGQPIEVNAAGGHFSAFGSALPDDGVISGGKGAPAERGGDALAADVIDLERHLFRLRQAEADSRRTVEGIRRTLIEDQTGRDLDNSLA